MKHPRALLHRFAGQPYAPAALLLALVGVPLLWSLWGAVAGALDAAAWQALAHDAQTLRALAMSLWTGVLASLLAVAASAWLLSRHFGQAPWHRLQRALAPMLALPHAAFAIGLVLLIAPSGWLLRALSPWATGMDAPPPWPTTQDPWGLGLIAVLAFKEIPFLLWTAMADLQRPDLAQRLQREMRVAHTLGYAPADAWWRVVWPQLWPRMGGPLLAVLAYSLTVVDVALVIGPTSPPTLAVLAWQWLQDASAATQAQGVAAAWLLTGLLALCAGLLWSLAQLPLWRRRWTRGVTPTRLQQHQNRAGVWGAGLLVSLYFSVAVALLLGSVLGYWPFPALWPQGWTLHAWQAVLVSSRTVWTTLLLGLASASVALVWTMAWLEWAPTRWQPRLRAVLLVPLALPAVLWVVGLHRLALDWGLDGHGVGVWLAHTLATLPYVLMVLQGPHAGMDPRLRAIAASLGHGRWVFVWRIQWPLLRGALAASFAVGFAVSVAQYLPTLYVGAGRFSTVTTEAVNPAAGGQRALTAAYAGLQGLLPLLVFGLAAWAGQARRWPTPQPTPLPK